MLVLEVDLDSLTDADWDKYYDKTDVYSLNICKFAALLEKRTREIDGCLDTHHRFSGHWHNEMFATIHRMSKTFDIRAQKWTRDLGENVDTRLGSPSPRPRWCWLGAGRLC